MCNLISHWAKQRKVLGCFKRRSSLYLDNQVPFICPNYQLNLFLQSHRRIIQNSTYLSHRQRFKNSVKRSGEKREAVRSGRQGVRDRTRRSTKCCETGQGVRDRAFSLNMNFFAELWQAFLASVKGFDTPKQLALGVSLGLIVGLLPKDTLLPYIIGTIALLTNANLFTLIVSGLFFSWLGPIADPLSHRIGGWLLTVDFLEPAWAWLYQIPLMPWTRFENTIVMGSLVLGVLSSFPVYSLSKGFFHAYGDILFSFIFRNRISRWLVGSPPSINP